LYGRGSAKLGTVKDPYLLEFLKEHDGQMLHAEVLEFAHPVTGKKMKFKAKMPDDMMELKYILEEM
jgi:23S rRNA pseudouridine1911/1915/1917 synthase